MLTLNVVCETSSFLKVLLFLKVARSLLFVVLPIILIVILTYRSFKNVLMAPEDYQNEIRVAVKKMGAVAIIFIIPILVNIVMSFTSKSTKDTYNICLENATMEKIEYYQGIEIEVDKARDLITKVQNAPTTENLTKAEMAVQALYGVANGSIIEDLEYNLATIRGKVTMSQAEFVCKAQGMIYENNKCQSRSPIVASTSDSNGLVYYSYKNTNDYLVINSKYKVQDYVKYVKDNRICQDQQNGTIYYDQCLCFAEEQVHTLTTGDSSRKSFDIPGKYYNNFTTYSDNDITKVLNVVYSEIISNRPVILHVNGNKAGTSRHYVTVIGFKSTVKKASDLKESDILFIDSYDCEVEQLHEWGTSRFMTTGKKCGKPDYSGYQVYMVK